MASTKQDFQAAYGVARKAVAGQQVRATRVGSANRYFFDITSKHDFSAVHGPFNMLQDVLQVISMKHAPAFPALAQRLASYKNKQAWLLGDDEADDDYIDN